MLDSVNGGSLTYADYSDLLPRFDLGWSGGFMGKDCWSIKELFVELLKTFY